jgi:hypothetical protein
VCGGLSPPPPNAAPHCRIVHGATQRTISGRGDETSTTNTSHSKISISTIATGLGSSSSTAWVAVLLLHQPPLPPPPPPPSSLPSVSGGHSHNHQILALNGPSRYTTEVDIQRIPTTNAKANNQRERETHTPKNRHTRGGGELTHFCAATAVNCVQLQVDDGAAHPPHHPSAKS